MRVLVVGGTGNVGGQVVRDLLARNAETRVLTRSEEHAKSLPFGVQGYVGELSDPKKLAPAFEGVDMMFFAAPIGPQETQNSINAVQAAKKSQPHHHI